MRIRNVCMRSLLYNSVFSIFLVARYAQWFSIENHGKFSARLRDISSRKPTDAILSRIVDLNALYQHPIPPRHFHFRFGFAVMGTKGFLTPNISLTLGNVTESFHCFIPLPDLYKFEIPLPTIPFLLPVWACNPPKNLFIVFYWL